MRGKKVSIVVVALLGAGLILPSFVEVVANTPKPSGLRKKREFKPIQPLKIGPLQFIQKIKAVRSGSESEPLKISIGAATSKKYEAPEPENLVKKADATPEPKKTLLDKLKEGSKLNSGKPKTSSKTKISQIGGPLTINNLRDCAHVLAKADLKYKFGCDKPSQGGMDCSGTTQYLLTKLGVKGIPRTSYDQYYWLKNKKMLNDVYRSKSPKTEMLSKIAPGDLIFWGNTWRSGHKVSHVMIYMGYNPKEKKHYIFGAKGSRSKGMFGNGVDLFDLNEQGGRLIGHARIPGLKY